MIRSRALLGSIAVAVFAAAGQLAFAQGPLAPADRARVTVSFDPGWRFLQANITDAEANTFDDSGWRVVDVPHDWSIEGTPDQANRSGAAGAFMPDGVAWYRKHFLLPAKTDPDRRVYIDFDGVMANSDVWINGFHLGKRPYGYVGFRYELTGHLNDKDNVIAVRADTSAQPASRWYSGSGIYRHVRLVTADPVHFDYNSTYVTTPKIGKDQATVHVRNTVKNDSDKPRDVTVEILLRSPDGKTAATAQSKPVTVPAGKTLDVEQDLTVAPQLWDLDHPNMYECAARIHDGAATLDDDSVSFGIRDAVFTADKGFMLNGKAIKLQGLCLHQDMGALGVAVPLAAWEHRLAVLKEAGCNAIRTAHNPMSPDFLSLCDRMGFLVMDEMFDCWQVGKTANDYHLYFRDWSVTDTRDTARRDRNHPSIVLYSAGNEIHDTPKSAVAIPILKSLVDTFHKEDPTRAVTQALFRPNADDAGGAYKNGLADLLDVVGTNYRYTELLAAQRDKPTRKIIGTENTKDKANWLGVRDNAGYSGEFLWAGADYLGEAMRWPNIINPAGLIEITDEPRPIAYMYQSWWSSADAVHIAREGGDLPTGNQPGEPQTRAVESADWSPQNLGPHEERVVAYSAAANVELLLNGKSLGSQRRAADGSGRLWRVPFEPGTLEAVATNAAGTVVARDVLKTAGKASKVVLSTEHSALAPVWDDISFVTATITDDKGVPLPLSNDLISFKIDGPGKITAVESASLNSHEPFASAERHAFHGTVIALVRATANTGKITLTANVANLTPGSLTLTTTDAYVGYWKTVHH